MTRNQRKSVQVLNYLANKEPNKKINRLKAIKLIWLADKFHLLKYRRTILKDHYCAMKNGPVASDTLDISRNVNTDYVIEYIRAEKISVESVMQPDTSLFSTSDIEVLDYIWEQFGGFDQWALRDLSHKYPEWKKHEQNILNPDTPNSIPMDLSDFYDIPTDEPDAMAHIFNIPKEMIIESKQTFENRKQFGASMR